MIWLIIWAIGTFISFIWLIVVNYNITLKELLIFIGISLGSWITLLLAILSMLIRWAIKNWNKPIIKK